MSAGNGRAALDLVAATPPDLVLMDVMMPELDGVQTCRHLKSDQKSRHIPVIMVTTKGQQEMVTAAYAAGCDDFVTKPIDKGELLKKIRGHLEKRAAKGGQP
jgi:CheY-like chemotaxis protein